MKTTLRKLTAAGSLLTLLSFPTMAPAETAVQAWAQRYNGPGNGDDQVYAVAVDSSNNVIVAGYSTGSGSGYDYATIKYSSVGVPLWTNRYNGPGNGDDQAYAVAVDSSNNVIVTGYSTNGASGNDYATIKYSSAGLPLWTNRYNGPGNSTDTARAVAVDGSNNVIVTGYSIGSGSYQDYATIKYSSAGVPLWTNRYNGPGNGNDAAYAVAVDGSNSVIVTGNAASSSGPSSYTTIKYSSAGVPVWTNSFDYYTYARAIAVDGSNNIIVTGMDENFEYATIKYSSLGVPLWTNRYTRAYGNIEYASAVAVDSTNNVIVTGYSYGSGDYYDYATIKYSSTGVPLWTNRYSGLGSQNYAYAVAVDGSNNVIVTGRSGLDYATIKYLSAGAPLWTNRYNGPVSGDNAAYAVAVDRSGNVIVTGASTGSGGNYDFATVKYVSVKEPVMTGLQLTNGMFQIEVDDVLQPGTLVIEACTDLAGWLPIFTNTTPTNVLFYTDPAAGNYPGRFYRAYQSP